MNERKCPIYVHEYNKTPSDNTYTNQSSKYLGKNTKSKSSNSQSSKSVLDKLEETYWASWKPSRERYPRSPRRHRTTSKNIAYGDTSDTLVKYFQKSNFKVSSGSVDDRNYQYDSKACHSSRLIEVSTQEIQTDDLTGALNHSEFEMKNQEPNEKNTDDGKVKSLEPGNENTENGEDTIPVKEKHLVEEEILTNTPRRSKLIEHKDSFIIHKKKQEEVKEPFQQPKCIKLYKKPGSSYLRGGTYPLKSCLKTDSSTKGHFRLGPPGSPMFVTTNSFNKKYGK